MKLVDTPHPDDQQLVGRYFDASRQDEALELHLLRCPACAARAGHLAAALDADHDRTLAVADAWFGADRLAGQRQAILNRLARPGADVVPFPMTGRQGAGARTRVIRSSRWAAAAAVLVCSVALGSGSWFGGSPSRSAERFTDVPLQVALAPVYEGEDALLLEIDRALARPQTRELRALEALTPRADEPVEF